MRRTSMLNPYIGHVLTPDGLKPDPSKVKATVAMPTPSDKKALQRLLGMITYLAKFLSNLSDVTEPLRRLLDKDVQWHWKDTHEKSWKQVKHDHKGTSVKVFRPQ